MKRCYIIISVVVAILLCLTTVSFAEGGYEKFFGGDAAAKIPAGWSNGEKTGWNGHELPPGLFKKLDPDPVDPNDLPADPALTGTLFVQNDILYMLVDTITDQDNPDGISGSGQVVRISATEGQEDEYDALLEQVSDASILGDSTIWGNFVGEGADTYDSFEFDLQGIGYGPYG